ncbi:MAG: ABC transporter permease [Ignavibacteriales bacterium]
MIRKIRGVISVLKRETLYIVKDMDLVTIILLSPLFYAFFYTSVYWHKSENNVPVVVVDMDKSPLAATLTRSLDAHQLVNISEIVPDFETAKDRIYKLEAQGVLYIPKGFESSLKAGKVSDLKIYLNTSRFLVSNDINKAVNEVAGTMGAGIKLRYFQAQGYNFEQAKEMIEPLQGEVKPLFNPTESYGDFLIPGLLVLILQQTLLMGLAESIAKEREENTLLPLYNTSGHSIWATITGKGLFYFILFASYAFLFFVLHFSIFRIKLAGSVSAVVVLTALLLISVIYMATFISSFFQRKIISLQVFAFSSYPLFLMSGYPWPTQAMPSYIRVLADLLPSTPYLTAFNRIIQMGAGWSDIVPEFLHLIILAVLGLILTRLRLKFLITKEKHALSNSSAAEPGFSEI